VLHGLRDPVVPILLVAAFFDGLADNSIHALFLGAVGVVLWWDAVRGSNGAASWAAPSRFDPATVPSSLMLAGSFLFAAIVGDFARYSWPMTIAVLVPAAIAVASSWGPTRGATERASDEADHSRTMPWIVVFVALGLWELLQLLQQPSFRTDSYDHPTISVLSDRYLASYAGRSIGLLVWLCIGWFLLRRRPARDP
jgi:hypothetical protein